MLRRNQRGQMGSGADIGAKTHRDLPQLAAGGGDNLGILQVDLRQLKRRFGAGHVGLQRIAIDDGRFTVLARHLQRRFRLLNIRRPLRRAGPCRITFADRQRTVGG